MRSFFEDKPKQHLYWVVIHVLMGGVMVFFPKILTFWYFFVFGVTFFQVFKKMDSRYIYLLLAYGVGFEIIGRISGLSPYIPWELNKYLVPLIVVFALIFEKGKQSHMLPGVLLILLCIPGWILGYPEFDRLSFSMLGIINLAFMVTLFFNRVVPLNMLFGIFRAFILPFITVLIHITLETPSFSEMEFHLGANFDTTGGFGSNQISTVLGAGAFVMAIAVMVRKKLFGNYLVDLALLGYFFFRGLLSFSRGGILVALISFAIFFYFIRKAKGLFRYGLRMRRVGVKQIVLLLAGLVVVFFVANEITNGVLMDRYKGETGGTLRGEREKTLNTLTTGRWDIMVSDLEMWSDYFFWGVGGGYSSSLRVNYGVNEIVAHTEFSRLLAEQGVWGLTIILFLIVYLPYTLLVDRNEVEKAFLFAFLALAIFTTFHAGMRTFITPFFVGLCLIRIPIPSPKKRVRV